MDMDYQVVTVGNIIKRFLIGWIIAGVLLVVVSCIKYKEHSCNSLKAPIE